jgi:formate hydrogenlyase transcriptional activator
MTESVKSENEISVEACVMDSGVSLEAILCTDELHRRPSRPPDYEKENHAIVKLASALADRPNTILQTLAETILVITQCDSAGLSLLTRDGKTPDASGRRFYWPAIAGMWNPHVGGGTPRNFGPCGDVLDQNRALLFRHFERRYPYLLSVSPAAEECLLVPFYVAGIAVGTIWAIMHNDHLKFDAEDDRVMASLGKFASSAYQALIHIEDLKCQVSDRKKAEVEAREFARGLEAKIRRLVDANVVGVVMWNLEGAITEANEAFLRMLQYDREDLASGRVRWTNLTPPEWRERDGLALAALQQTGIFQPFEKEYFRKDGSRVPVLLGGAFFEGSKTEGVAFIADLTEEKRAEEALRRQTSVRADASAAFANGSDLKEILHGCVEGIVRHLDAAFARIWTLNKDDNMLELQASAGMYTNLDGRHSRIRMGDLKVGLIAKEKKPHLINDLFNDPRVSDKDWARACGLISFAGYPLIVEERVVGVMALFARHSLSNATLETLASVADAIAQGIERKRAEEKLRQDECELRRITDAIPEAVGVLRPDGTVIHANKVVLDYTGMTLEDLNSPDDFRIRLFHPDDFERVREKRQSALEHGAPFELEIRLRRKDGQYRWFLFRYNPLRDDEGRIIRWYATGIDIEDRKQAEERMRNENMALREEIDHTSMFEEIVGSSFELRKVLQHVAKVAPMDSTVLILGETGTGKELIARAIHKRSNRSARAFIQVNCAAIPSSLIASELFGHEKGAFTGALQRRLGRFESANGGTIFLDEIGELPAETQIALLRVLQEREIERVGGNQSISVDVRVLAATHRDLKAAVAAGSFRQDLFYRLNVFPIQIPSLRERLDDIPLLVEYLIERYAKKAGKKIRKIRKQTLELFQAYDWPGNIRELQNVIERAVVLCDGETFSVDETWLKSEQERQDGPAVRLASSIADREREMIMAALAQSHGQVSGSTGAAAKLGLPRQTLESKIKNLGIDKHRYTSRSA